MHRSISIHPLSLALGLVFGGICLLSMGQATFTPTPLGSTVRVEYMPHPRDMVTIRGATPYVVPPGKVFVLTGLGTTTPTAYGASLNVNGVQEIQAPTASPGWNNMTIREVPPGFTVAAGSTIEVCEPNGQPSACLETTPRAWGYLAPQ